MLRISVKAAGVFLLCLPTAVVAQRPAAAVKPPFDPAKSSIAELFPAETIAYAELVQPAEVARGLRSFLEGSVIERLPELLAQRRERWPGGWFPGGEEMQGGFLLGLLGPDLIAEIGRLRGAAVAITGLNEAKEPIIVAVILTGGSQLPGLVTRAILCMNPSVRVASRVGGIPVFGHADFDNAVQAPPGIPAPARPNLIVEPPFIAMSRGVVVIGSQRSAVEDVLRRWLGSSETPFFENTLQAQAGASLRHRPGVFGWCKTQALPDLVGSVIESDDESAAERQKTLGELLSPEMLPSISMHLGISEELLELRLTGENRPSNPHPVVELVQSPPRPNALAVGSPSNAVAGVAIHLNDGANWFRRMIALSDRVLKSIGLSASNWVGELDHKMGRSLADSLFAKITEITIASPSRQDLPQGAVDLVMWSVWAKDAAAAEEIESLLPALASAMVDEKLEPVRETIDGHRVFSINSARFPWNSAIHYGRKGNRLVLGLDRRLVAALLSGQSLEKNSAGLTRREVNQPNVLGFWNWGDHVPDLFADWSVRPQVAPGMAQPVDPQTEQERRAAIRKTWSEALSALPPLVAVLDPGGSRSVATFLLRQSLPSSLRIKLIDGAVTSWLDGSNLPHDEPKAPPPPPPPIKN